MVQCFACFFGFRGMFFDPEVCRPALPLDGEYDEEEIERKMELGPPETAEDYLMRVRCVDAGSQLNSSCHST